MDLLVSFETRDPSIYYINTEIFKDTSGARRSKRFQKSRGVIRSYSILAILLELTMLPSKAPWPNFQEHIYVSYQSSKASASSLLCSSLRFYGMVRALENIFMFCIRLTAPLIGSHSCFMG